MHNPDNKKRAVTDLPSATIEILSLRSVCKHIKKYMEIFIQKGAS